MTRIAWRDLQQARRRPSAAGYMLVELLLVVLIIGILAAIALPAFMRQREKAWDVAVESDLRNAAIAQDAFLAAGGPTQYATSVGQLMSTGFRPSSDSHYFGGTFAMGVSSSATEYCLTARSRSGAYFGYSSRLGPVRKSTPIDPASCS